MGDVVEALKKGLGEDCVLTGDAVSDRASGIWRSVPIQAKAIVRPRSTEQVSQALAMKTAIEFWRTSKPISCAITCRRSWICRLKTSIDT